MILFFERFFGLSDRPPTFKYLIPFCVILFAAYAPPAFASPEKININHTRGNATILIYHHFDDDRYPTTNVPLKNFQEQMAYLAKNNYTVIPLAELVDMLTEHRSLPEKVTVITIDDGYRTVYSNAWPILKKYGFPFTVFLYVEGMERGYRNYLSWEQIKEMRAAGVDFQDHGFSHHHLADKPTGMNESEYGAWIRNDLAKGANILTVNLGKKPRFLAIPYGEYNRTVIKEAKKVGYDAIFTQDAGSVSNDTDLFMIPREPILGQDWITIKHFENVLKRADLPVSDMEPPIEPLADLTVPRFGARITYPDRYIKDSFGIYVSELGWKKARFEKNFVSIDNTSPLTRKQNRVMISAREKDTGRTAVRFWLLIKPD